VSWPIARPTRSEIPTNNRRKEENRTIKEIALIQ